MYFISVILLCIVSFTHASVVKFLPSTKFNLPINFKDGKIPCSKETVVFPETIIGNIILDSKIEAKELILPKDGDFFLENGIIELGSDEADSSCTHEGYVYYVEKAVASWGQADVWSSPRFNEATPDAERVPCFDDIVEFPADAQFTLYLPIKTQYVSGIKIGNESFSSRTFIYRVAMESDQPQQFIANSFYGTGLVVKQELCLSRAGCSCQKYPLKINCEAKYCPAPSCVDPVQPIGHCCKICGGVISFDIDQSFDIMIFKDLVENTVARYGKDDLVYHVSRVPPNKILLIVVDKKEYSGTSAEVVNKISNEMEPHWVQSTKYVDISGSPLYKSGLGGKIFVSMFFLVVLLMGGIYLYYYKLPAVSDMRFPILHRNTPAAFSRFQTRTDSVVCLTRRDSVAPIGQSEGAAFRNPLYDSTIQRAQVEDHVGDE